MCSSFSLFKRSNSLISDTLNFCDYLFWNLRGMQWVEQGKKLIIPNGYWLSLHLLLAIQIGQDNFESSNRWELQIVLRFRKWEKWWKSRFYDCIIRVILYYSILILTTILITRFNNGKPELPHKELVEGYGGIYHYDYKSFYMGLGLMILSSITISLIQLFITILSGVKIGFLCTIGILVLTIYSSQKWNVGNCLMMLRTSEYQQSELKTSIFACIMIITLIYNLGHYIVNKKEILR